MPRTEYLASTLKQLEAHYHQMRENACKKCMGSTIEFADDDRQMKAYLTDGRHLQILW